MRLYWRTSMASIRACDGGDRCGRKCGGWNVIYPSPAIPTRHHQTSLTATHLLVLQVVRGASQLLVGADHLVEQPALLLEADVHDEDHEGDDDGDNDHDSDQRPLPCGIPSAWSRKGEGGDGKTMKAMMTEMVTMTATSGHFQEESHPSERKGEEGIAEGGGGGEKGVPHPFTQKGAVDGGENGAPLPLRCSPIHPSARQ